MILVEVVIVPIDVGSIGAGTVVVVVAIVQVETVFGVVVEA